MSNLRRRIQEHRNSGASVIKITKKTAPKKCNLFVLPIEVIGTVIGYLDIADVISMISTCKYIKSLMHPDGTEGRHIWNLLRKRLGWPDPAAIGMTDFQFLKCRYGRGCNFCSNAPRVHTPKWEFRGLRMCKSCLSEQTVRHYYLSSEKLDRCRVIPFIEIKGRSWWTPWAYRIYLKDSIPDHPLSVEDDARLTTSLEALTGFRNAVKCNERSIAEEKRARIVEIVEKRKKDVNEYMKTHFPEIYPGIYKFIQTYTDAVYRTSPFGKRSQGIFHKDLQREVENNFRVFYRRQFLYHVNGILDHSVSVHLNLVDLNTLINETLFSIQASTQYRKLPTSMEVTVLSKNVVTDALRQFHRKHWFGVYVNAKNYTGYDLRELRFSRPYISALPEDEAAFIKLVIELEHRVDLRSMWLQKYKILDYPYTDDKLLGTYEIMTLKGSRVYETVLPEDEIIFARMAEAARQRLETRSKWWEKYVDCGLEKYESDVCRLQSYRIAEKDHEAEFESQVQLLRDRARST